MAVFCVHTCSSSVGVGVGGVKAMQDAQCGSFLRVGGAAVQTVSSVVGAIVASDWSAGRGCSRRPEGVGRK